MSIVHILFVIWFYRVILHPFQLPKTYITYQKKVCGYNNNRRDPGRGGRGDRRESNHKNNGSNRSSSQNWQYQMEVQILNLQAQLRAQTTLTEN